MPAVPVCLLEPIWEQFAALLPARPAVDPGHPLGRHRARQIELRLSSGGNWVDRNLVFCNQTGGPLDPGWQRQTFQEALDAGLPCLRFHEQRHTAATLLLTQGVHPTVVGEMLGHATITLGLDTYSHLVAAMHVPTSAAMDALLGA